MHSTSIRPEKLADAVARHIQELILEGALPPGERLLPERELAAKLDVSRPSLRDALDLLVERGLLMTDANGACYVSDKIGQSVSDPLMLLLNDPRGRFDCMEFRAVVEAAAAGFAAQRATQADRDELKRIFAAMQEAHGGGDADAVAANDADFHLAIYGATHNVMLLQLMRSLETILRNNVYLNRGRIYEHRTDHDERLAEHKAVFDAILDRDPERAEEAARQHIFSTMRAQREILDEEQRQETAVRRLSRIDLLAPPKHREAKRDL